MNNSNTYLLLLKISFKRTVFSINVYRYIERREETDIYENKISLFRWRDEKIVNHFTEDLYSSPIGRGDIRNGRSHCETTRVSRISPGNRHDIQSGNYKTAVENHRHREHMSSRCHPWSTFFDVDTGANACTHARTNGRARIPTPPCTHRLCAHSSISARIHVCVRRKFWIIWHVVVHVIIQIDVEIPRVERTSDFSAANPVLRYSLFLQSLALKAKLNTINFAYIIIRFLWCTAY